MMADQNVSMHMNILLKGEPKIVPADSTAAHLIEILELSGKRLAVEINEEIVPRSQYATYRLQAGDRIEIVHAIGGG
jgi:sulfur carrier protein